MKKKTYFAPQIKFLRMNQESPVMAGSDESYASLEGMEDGGNLSKPLNIWENE
ncbi:MAG: hypothetical protein IJ562_09610 [Prevotella sp.]|nr:hypothetical protein [Prevotella sp.]